MMLRVASFMRFHLRSLTYYDVLEVSPKATQAEIRQAYLGLSKKLHPDATGSQSSAEKNSKKFVAVNEAYGTLSRPKERNVYDRQTFTSESLDDLNPRVKESHQASTTYQNPLRPKDYVSPYRQSGLTNSSDYWTDYYTPHSKKRAQRIIQQKLGKNDAFWKDYNEFTHEHGGGCIVSERNKRFKDNVDYQKEFIINYGFPFAMLFILFTLTIIVSLDNIKKYFKLESLETNSIVKKHKNNTFENR